MRLDHHQYRIKIADTAVAGGNISASAGGDPTAQIAAHVAETVRQNADELLTRDATKHLIEELKRTSPVAVDELIPGIMKLAEVQQVLQALLREDVSIRPLGLIFEALGDYAAHTRDPLLLAEQVRQRLARTICARYRDQENQLWVITFDPALEDQIRENCHYDEQGFTCRLPPEAVESLCQAVQEQTTAFAAKKRPAVVLVSPWIRMFVKQLTLAHLPQLAVLGYNEITRDTKIKSAAMIPSHNVSFANS
jgi:flagellar biosynthesis protein FlhA